MRFEVIEGVTLEAVNPVTIEVMKAVDGVRKVCEAYRTLPYDDVMKATHYDYHVISDLMEKAHYDKKYAEYRDIIEDAYWEEEEVSSQAYRDRYRDEFLAFEAKNVDYATGVWIGSDDDYSFYSDWSKDLYGYRKRWKAKAV
jgi:hypothetical protein